MSISTPRFALPLLLATALLFAVPGARAANSPPARHGLASAPAGLVAAIARTQAKDAATNPSLAIAPNGCAMLKTGPRGQVLHGCFGAQGSAFTLAKTRLHLRLTAWGREGALRPVAFTRSATHANRIANRGRHLTEWWQVLPMGYEQGFTLNQAPAGHGRVVLQLRASASPTVEKGTLAWGALRYGKLQVTDANGTVLPATLAAHGRTLTLAFNATHARYPITVDPLVWVQQAVTASNGAANDQLGISVALSGTGNTALVGVPNKTVGANSNQGTAYVYTLTGGAWSQTAKLTASDGAAYNNFGWSVALSGTGTTALVGAYVGGNIAQGTAYVYTLTNGTWSQTQELTASNGTTNAYFGSWVTLSSTGTTALVGAPGTTVGTTANQGAAYVYTLAGGTWSQTAELTASDGAANDYFGSSVALSSTGTTALVGASNKTVGSNVYQGEAYVYTLTNGTWSQTQELTSSDGAANDNFGWSVALSNTGTTALVGAYFKNVGSNYNQGEAYVYTLTNGAWTQTAELTASGSTFFGNTVALSSTGTTALVGAYGQGEAYVYTLAGGTWSQTQELTASNGTASDSFGYSVALSSTGTTALVGAPYKNVGSNSSQGAAYFLGGSNLSAVLSTPAQVRTNQTFNSQYILTNSSTTASAALTATVAGASHRGKLCRSHRHPGQLQL